MTIGSTIKRGCRLLPIAALLVSLIALAPAYAQRAVPETVPKLPGGTGAGTGGGAGGIGGGAGLRPTLPELRQAPSVAPTPQVAPAVPAVPAAPAVVRFRCQLDSGAETCKGSPLPDGGGSEEECNCARDHCRDDPAGYRVCEKQ